MDIQSIFLIVLLSLYLFSDMFLTISYKRKFNRNPDNVFKSTTNESQKFLGRNIVIMHLFYLVVAIFHITQNSFSGFVNIISFLNNSTIWLIGFVLGLFSIMMSIVSRLHLGSSWRVGIDENTEDKLVVSGIYKWIRNPFFLSVLLFQFSLILVSPNAITILNFFIGFILWGFQARREEEFMIIKYGDEYLKYKNKTGRFVPKF